MTTAQSWAQLLADAPTRDRIATSSRDDIQRLIDAMEGECDHDELPPAYDWLVSLRNGSA